MYARTQTEGWSEIAIAAVEGAERRWERALALEGDLAELTAHLDAARCRWLELISEWHHLGGGDSEHTHSLVQWVAWRLSVSHAEAREFVRVAERVRGLPLVHEAFSCGRLSYSKVRALTRVAGPVDEAELVELAGLMTVSQLERVLRVYRRVTRERAREAQERAFLRYFWDEDGSLCLQARLGPGDGAAFLWALQAARDSLRERRWRERAGAQPSSPEPPSDAPAPQAPAVEAEPPTVEPPTVEPTPEELRVTNLDALVAMAESSVQARTRARPGPERSQVVVHVDVETLTAGAAGRCELEQGPAIAVETARRLACDSSLVTMVERDGQPLSVGRKTRKIPTRLRRALHARDGGCRFPGCTNTRFTESHHIEHWAQGGTTSADNLIELCHKHHHLLHEGECTLEGSPDGEVRFRNRRGVVIPNVPRSPPSSHPEALLQHNRKRGLTIDQKTSRNGTGERMDLNLTLVAVGNAIGWGE